MAAEIDTQLPAPSADLRARPTEAGRSDTRGKHRIMVELKRLEQETKFLQKELEELDSIEGVATAVEELLHSVERSPDPLLPATSGPVNPSWERWFEGPYDAHVSGCWIL